MSDLKPIERAITYIENRLGDVCMEDVAREAGYSYYHLTRLFTAVLGESVGSYIKKRRLADGAHKLLYTNKRVIDIALENGFESPEAFSRAFKAAYHMSPSTYRNNRLDTIISAKKQLRPELLKHIAFNVTVKPRIEELDGIKAAGIRGATTLKDNVVPQLWQRFLPMCPAIPHASPSGRSFGVCECSETIYTMNSAAPFSEFVGVEVESFEDMPNGIVTKTLRPGRYAVFTHTGSLKNLRDTYDYIYGTWLLAGKIQLSSSEDFELYDERFLGPDHPDSQLDIYIPLID